MTDLLRSTSAQVLPWTVVMLVVLLPLALGAMGAGAAYLAKDQAQAAADAAALAAAGEAALWERLAVSWHEFSCLDGRTAAGGPAITCRDGPAETTNLPRTFAVRLFARTADGIPGWAEATGCGAVGSDPAPAPSAHVAVCNGWRLQAGGLGAAYGLGFPRGADPAAAVTAYLQANTADLRAQGVSVALLLLKVDAATGQVELTVRATEPGNPLGLLTGQTTTVTVQAGSQREVAPPPGSGA